MADNQKLDNGLLNAFVAESSEQPDGSQRQVVEIGSSQVSFSTVTFTTLAPTKVSVTGTEGEILASNTTRQGGQIVNLGTEAIYISNTTATTDDFPIPGGGSFEIPKGFTGALRAITGGGTCDVRILEGDSA